MRVDKLRCVLHEYRTDTDPDPARAPPPLSDMEDNMVSPSASDLTFGRTAPSICVRDIHVAHDFYSRILGFGKVFENGDPVGFMVLKKDQAEIHLSRKSDHKASTVNVMHMFVNDAAALYAICEAEGVRIVKKLMNKEYGQRAFVFADLDGNRIDVGERLS